MHIDQSPIVSTLLQDEPDIADIVNNFVNRLPKIFQAIRDAYENGNEEEFKRGIHDLKGNAGTFGYNDLSKLTQNIEFELITKNQIVINLLFEQIDKMILRIQLGHCGEPNCGKNNKG